MSTRKYRGYISSNMRERSVPQRIQQLVIRDYCKRNGMEFLLSATEYCMGGTMILDSIKEDIVMYSMFQFPRGWKTDKEIHFAAENCKYTPDLDETFALMDLYDHNRSQLSSTIACLNQA